MNIQRIQVDIIRTKAAVTWSLVVLNCFVEILYQDKEVLIFIREDQNVFKKIK